MAVIGGSGHIAGAIIGATLFTTLHSVLQDLLPLITSRAGNLEKIIYGCLFILVFATCPVGLVGMLPRFGWASVNLFHSLPNPLTRAFASEARIALWRFPACQRSSAA